MAALNPPRISPLGVAVLLGALLAGIFVLWWCQRMPTVTVEMTPQPTHLGPNAKLSLQVRAHRGGVRWAELRLVQAETNVVLGREEYPEDPQNQRRLEVEANVADLGLAEGPARLEVHARDGFWRPLGVSEDPSLALDVTLDFTPPRLEVIASTRYPAQGGAGIAVLSCDKTAHATLAVGSSVYPAFEAASGDTRRIALFPLPWDHPPQDPVLAIATDPAGNRTTREVPAVIKRIQFAKGAVDLREDFLRRKIAELVPNASIETEEELAAAFLTLNRDLRAEAAATKRQLATTTQSTMLWSGAFQQPRNTKVFSNFAETRDYRFAGRALDTQVHLGFDLASVKHAPVPAANAGVVVYAGPLNIYGNTVVLDHGLGLATLYSHLSAIDVTVGEAVAQTQTLGRTGTSGLAVGDHLHYEVLVHGVPVTPVQWWDANWVRDHIGGPLRDAGLDLDARGSDLE